MNILKADLQFKSTLSKRKSTAKIIIHHAAAKSATVQDVHRWHLSNGWAGIGYHFYVRKNGEIWQGRPIDTLGAHCYGQNYDSIGICFEGNFDVEQMSNIQIEAGKKLLAYILGKYPGLKICKHRDFNATACPGEYFPWEKIVGGTTTNTVKDDDKLTTLRNGSKGTDVKILQCLLNCNGANLTVDGAFGSGTTAAVKTFQSAKKLTADGIVGTKTWEALAAVKVSDSAEAEKLKTKIANAQKALA